MAARPKLVAVPAVSAHAATACGGSSNSANSSSGGGGKTLVVGIDLPMQGASHDASQATADAMQLYLDSVGGKAGKFKVKLKIYDDSTAAAAKWDTSQCAANAQAHVQNKNEVAVMGTYNSGCAQIEAPVLNQAPDGPLLMVSHANTYPGLTKGWSSGEPQKYQPSGKKNYARVITTDDYQGSAAAQFAAQKLGVKKCFVLDDNETYGQGVAKAFADEAQKQGIQILGQQAWDGKQPNYTALFQKIKSMGPDCVYLGGIFDNNGGQLIKDKVAVLGDNNAVKMMGPDGFTGYPDEDKLAEAQGEYLTFAGLSSDQLKANGGAAATLLESYKTKYGQYPPTNYALYGVAALQVILKAISQSDGTRASVDQQVFSGSGISIDAKTCVLGKAIHIDPSTGDVDARDISVLVMKDNQEQFDMAWPVS
jgi:branched-chain amino acid transport system substrate-binding protein